MAYFLVHSLANWLYLSLVTQFRLDTEMSDQNNKWKNSTKIYGVLCALLWIRIRSDPELFSDPTRMKEQLH